MCLVAFLMLKTALGAAAMSLVSNIRNRKQNALTSCSASSSVYCSCSVQKGPHGGKIVLHSHLQPMEFSEEVQLKQGLPADYGKDHTQTAGSACL